MAKLAVLILALALPFLVFCEDFHEVFDVHLGKVSSETVVEKEFFIEKEIKSVLSLCECLKVKVKRANVGQDNKSQSTILLNLDPKEYHGEIEEEAILIDTDDRWIKVIVHAFVE